jgi:ABC-type xylose transport system substrate-binding protein
MSHKLFRIARRPLTAKELLVVLPITNKERLRWTKDGRLMQQGTTSMKRGQAISVTTYAIGPVEALLADPEEVERW